MSTAIAEIAEAGGVLAVIERAALNPDIDVQKMQALFELQERIMARHAEMSFSSAFAEMQSEIPPIAENGKIEFSGKVQSRYALFEDINEVVKPILQKHGFGIMFKVETSEAGISVRAILMHKDGHKEETPPMVLEADTSGSKNKVQANGSSVSYAKRYVLIAMLNITTRGEDDDGQSAGVRTIDEAQQATLQALIEEVKQDKPKFFTYATSKARRQIKKLSEIPASLYAELVTSLEKKRGA